MCCCFWDRAFALLLAASTWSCARISWHAVWLCSTAQGSPRLHERPAEHIGALPIGWLMHPLGSNVHANAPIGIITCGLSNDKVLCFQQLGPQLLTLEELLVNNLVPYRANNLLPQVFVESLDFPA